MRYTTYESFVKDLLSRGYSWDEVEYYWRHPEELEEIEQEEIEGFRNNTIQKTTKCNNNKINTNNKIILVCVLGVVFSFTILLFAEVIQ